MGIYGIILIMGHAGFISSTVGVLGLRHRFRLQDLGFNWGGLGFRVLFPSISQLISRVWVQKGLGFRVICSGFRL